MEDGPRVSERGEPNNAAKMKVLYCSDVDSSALVASNLCLIGSSISERGEEMRGLVVFSSVACNRVIVQKNSNHDFREKKE